MWPCLIPTVAHRKFSFDSSFVGFFCIWPIPSVVRAVMEVSPWKALSLFWLQEISVLFETRVKTLWDGDPSGCLSKSTFRLGQSSLPIIFLWGPPARGWKGKVVFLLVAHSFTLPMVQMQPQRDLRTSLSRWLWYHFTGGAVTFYYS